jgi:RNA polymerase sigma factor (sigma-70 family)
MGVLEKIPLAEDELEALRLCDLEGMTQEEAGRHMGVSRGTVQRTVKAARSKVARALVDGAALVLNQVSREE